jgi:hypothetical protein
VEYIKIKNWERFQHYKYRNVAWIKLYVSLLENEQYERLPDTHKALLHMLWLLAARKNNCIPADPDWIYKHTPMNKVYSLEPLVNLGFIEIYENASVDASTDASKMLEQSREEKRREEYTSSPNGSDFLFETFWKAYPRKVGKSAARRKWRLIKPTAELAEKMLLTIEASKRTDQWKRDGGQFIPHPATWLHQGRWEDEIAVKNPATQTRLCSCGCGQIATMSVGNKWYVSYSHSVQVQP